MILSEERRTGHGCNVVAWVLRRRSALAGGILANHVFILLLRFH